MVSMVKSNTVSAPSLSWVKGWRLHPSAWTHPHDFARGPGFRTLGSPGDIAPDEEKPLWSLDGGIRDFPLRGRTQVLANAYRIMPSDSDTFAQLAVVVAPGVILGHTALPVPPSLFSAELERHDSDSMQWIEKPGENVVLLRRLVSEGLRFCLVVTPEDHETAVQLAQQYLESDPMEPLRREFQARRYFWERMRANEASVPVITYAVEHLVGRLRTPEGPMRFRWSAAAPEADAAFYLNQLYPLIKAWIRIDIGVAEDLVKSALSTQKPDGTLLAWNYSDGRSGDNVRAWPLFALCALEVARAGVQTDFLEYVYPALERYLEQALNRFTEDGFPRWRSPREAFIPETCDRKLATVDLTAMLLCEIDAFRHLSRLHSGNTHEIAFLNVHEEKLRRHLLEWMWDDKRRNFRDRYIGGSHIARLTLSGFMPLLWTQLDRTRERSLVRHMENPKTFWKPEGLPLWEAWEQDPEPPPIPALHQFFILDGLRRKNMNGTLDQLRERLRESLTAQYRKQHTLPADLSRVAAPRPADDATEPDPMPPDSTSAALAIDITPVRKDKAASPNRSPFTCWLVKNRTAVIVTPIVLAVLALLGIVIGFMYKKTPPHADVYALSGLAQLHYQQGRHDEAIRIYRELSERLDQPASIDLLMGNTYLHMNDPVSAERHYRSALEKGLESPRAHINLGLALYQQNKLSEARDVYETFIQDFQHQYPELAERAHVSLDIINRKYREKAQEY